MADILRIVIVLIVMGCSECMEENRESCRIVTPLPQTILVGTGNFQFPFAVSKRSALLLVGGYDGGHLKSVEQFQLHAGDGGEVCRLADLPEERGGLTLDVTDNLSLVACGGGGGSSTSTTCVTLELGAKEWKESFKLSRERVHHSSWVTERGLMLLGGQHSRTTAELVPLRPDQPADQNLLNLPHDVYDACSFPLGDQLVITGGSGNMDKAYTMNSDLTVKTYLPSLNQGRRDHGCSYYTSSGAQSTTFIMTGGYDGHGPNNLASTELLAPGSRSWTLVKNSLPTARSSLRVGRLDNKVLATGGWDGAQVLDEILVFNVDTKKWEMVGKMKEARGGHGLAVVSSSFCN